MELYLDPSLAALVAGLLAFVRQGQPPAWLDGRPRVLVAAVILGAALALCAAFAAGGDPWSALARGVVSGASAVGGVSLLGYGARKVGEATVPEYEPEPTLESEATPLPMVRP